MLWMFVDRALGAAPAGFDGESVTVPALVDGAAPYVLSSGQSLFSRLFALSPAEEGFESAAPFFDMHARLAWPRLAGLDKPIVLRIERADLFALTSQPGQSLSEAHNLQFRQLYLEVIKQVYGEDVILTQAEFVARYNALESDQIRALEQLYGAREQILDMILFATTLIGSSARSRATQTNEPVWRRTVLGRRRRDLGDESVVVPRQTVDGPLGSEISVTSYEQGLDSQKAGSSETVSQLVVVQSDVYNELQGEKSVQEMLRAYTDCMEAALRLSPEVDYINFAGLWNQVGGDAMRLLDWKYRLRDAIRIMVVASFNGLGQKPVVLPTRPITRDVVFADWYLDFIASAYEKQVDEFNYTTETSVFEAIRNVYPVREPGQALASNAMREDLVTRFKDALRNVVLTRQIQSLPADLASVLALWDEQNAAPF